jgi:penicillin-binding protein 1A
MRRKVRYPRVLRFFRTLNATVVVLASGTGGFVLGGLQSVRAVLPRDADLTKYRPLATTKIFSTERHKDGKVTYTLLARIAKEDREPAPLHKIPRHLRNATIAIEDARFHYHRGVDPRGIVRAAWTNLRYHRIVQGASTITQQLVRNVWLSQERTLDRKLKEILLALQVERKFSKDEILQMYLNEIYYGHGAYGVQAASQLFFGKDVSELTLGESALLAGLPRAPSRYSPYDHPQGCKKRRKVVLRKMLEAGYITSQQRDEADNEQIQMRLKPLRQPGVAALRAPYFTNLVIQQLCEDENYGVDAVYKGGLRVYTTLDMRLQEIAERELTAQVEQLRKQRNIEGGLEGQGALACVDVHTGDVLAMVGGVGEYQDIQWNRAHPGPPKYGRQPGSSFKPYIFAAAFESGYGPSSVFSGGPITIPLGPGMAPWRPKNYSPGQGGDYALRRALAYSVNLVAVRVLREIGLDKARRYASRIINIPISRLRPVWSLALGTSELSPLEQASGYAVFASGGLRADRRFIRTICDYNGDEIESRDSVLRQVLRRETAISMISVLGSVITMPGGTGYRARAVGCPAGGKTGTTQGDRDAWWVGFTPDLSCAVWVGNDSNKPMRRAAGGRFAAPVWASFMKQAIKVLGCEGEFPEGAGVKSSQSEEPEEEEEEEAEQELEQPTLGLDMPQPGGRRVTLCTESGGLATRSCPVTREVTLGRGEALPPPCWIHGTQGSPGTRPAPSTGPGPSPRTATVTVCRQSGLLATPHCPDTEERTFPAGREPKARCNLHGRGPTVPTPGREPPNEDPGDLPPPAPEGGTRPGAGEGAATPGHGH